jgi:hypothetical protein
MRLFDYFGHKNPFWDNYHLLEGMVKDEEFKDRITPEEKRGMERIEKALTYEEALEIEAEAAAEEEARKKNPEPAPKVHPNMKDHKPPSRPAPLVLVSEDPNARP